MILNLMKKTYSPLVFGLFCGLVYFGLALKLILSTTKAGGGLLAFFFFPAIVCGGALFIVKAVKMLIEEENTKKLNFMFWSHIILAVVSIVFTIEAFI